MSLKEVKQRILSIKNTQKITSAMRLVSAAKLRRAQNAIENMRPYGEKLDAILHTALKDAKEVKSPYTSVRNLQCVAIVPVSSHTTLCGAFNSNIIRRAKEMIKQYAGEVGVENVLIYPVGKKVAEALQKEGYTIDDAIMNEASQPQYSNVSQFAYTLMSLFEQQRIDRVVLLYTKFCSASHLEITETPLLPIELNIDSEGEEDYYSEYILEPTSGELIASLLPKVVALQLYTVLLDSAASEHAARVIAMQTASDNADDLIESLTREYNKSRQQAITNELLDIVSGSVER